MKKLTFSITIVLTVISLFSSPDLKDLKDLKNKYPHLIEYNEKTINILGYQLMKSSRMNEAIEVFKLNAHLFPGSWNVYDSLGEVYMRAKKNKLAIKYYTKSISINPGNTNGQRMLEKLRYPRLAKFTGDYEYYRKDRYRVIKVFIEKGKLVGLKPGTKPISLNPLNSSELQFKGEESNNPSLITFKKNKKDQIIEIKWLKGKEILSVPRKNPNVIKKQYPIKELQQDFKQFRHHLTHTFPHPYEFISQKLFDEFFLEKYKKINKAMSLREFYTILAPLKAKIGCGHAYLDYPAEYAQNFKFPLILRFLGNKCYLEKNLAKKPSTPAYSEILAINGVKIHSIIKTLKADISADGYNDNFKTSALSKCFQYYYANHYGTPEKFSFQFRKFDNEGKREVIIRAIPCRGINYSNKKYAKLNCEILPQKKTAIMTVSSFIYYGKRNKIFFSYVDDSFSKIKKAGVKNLIMDLRGNDGGDPFCAAYLLSYIEKKPIPYYARPYGKYAKLAQPVKLAENNFKGKLFFLIDGHGFSTTGHFCALLKYHQLGTFIGTETGGTYTCNAAGRTIQMKNTRLLLEIARKSFVVAVTGLPKNRGIIPDFIIKPDINDLRNNKDRVMEFTLKLINK